MKFSIRCNTNQKLTGHVPKGDEVALHAVRTYGNLLNTPERRNRAYSAVQFAELIRLNNPDVEVKVLTHLRDLGRVAVG